MAIVEVLVAKSTAALAGTGLSRLVVAGGVGANRRLRQALLEKTQKVGAEVFFPPIALCTDNGAMIAYAAAERINAGLETLERDTHGFEVRPRWPLADLLARRA